MIENGISFLQVLVFLFGRRQNHSSVGAVNFKEDRIVTVGLVSEGLRIHQILILMVCKSSMD